MAKTMNVRWIEKLRFVATDDSKHAVLMSSQDAENGVAMSPAQLLLAGLGGCTAYDVVGILEKKRQPLTGLEVIVSAEQQPDPPWTYRKFHLHFVVRGRGLREKAVCDAIELSEEKYCSVAATLRGSAEITFDYEIIEDD